MLDLRQELFAVAAQVAQLVELLIDAALNHAAVAQRNWGLGDDGVVDALAQIAEFVDADAVQSLSSRRRAAESAAATRAQRSADRGQLRQRSGQREDVARVGGFERDPAEQALQIEDAIQRAAQFFAGDGFFYLRLRPHPDGR